MALPVDHPTRAELSHAAALANALIGKPYREGGRGPDVYDCMGVARELTAALWGVLLPDAPFPELMAVMMGIDARRAWRRIARPAHGALGLTTNTANPRHVVVYLANDRGRVLHALAGHGVVSWGMLQLRLMFREVHWYVPTLPADIRVAA